MELVTDCVNFHAALKRERDSTRMNSTPLAGLSEANSPLEKGADPLGGDRYYDITLKSGCPERVSPLFQRAA